MPEATVPAEGVRVGVAAGADGRRRVSVCAGTACVFAGSMKIHDAFAAEIAAAGLQDQVEVSIIGCHGLCSQGPLAVVSDGDTYYPRLKLKDVKTVVEEHLPAARSSTSSCTSTPPPASVSPAPTTSRSTRRRRASRCATWASSTRRASTSTSRAAATRRRARRSRR